MGVCNCSMFCCTLLNVHSSIAIILMGKRKLIALLNLSSWCLVIVEGLFLAVPRGCLQFVIVVFPDHTHSLFLQSPVLEFDKNCTQNAYFPQEFEFCIFEPQNHEVMENSSKTPLNVSSLQYTYLGKKYFQYH